MKHISKVILFVILLSWGTPLMTQAAPNNDPYYSAIYRYIAYNSGHAPEQCNWLTDTILHYCAAYKVDPILATALLKAESNFRPEAVSPVGAIGIAQLMPETAAALGVNPYDPEENIAGGIHYLAQQLQKYARMGSWQATYALAAYNAGPGAIQKYKGLPPYSETYNYVTVINDNYYAILSLMH